MQHTMAGAHLTDRTNLTVWSVRADGPAALATAAADHRPDVELAALVRGGLLHETSCTRHPNSAVTVRWLVGLPGEPQGSHDQDGDDRPDTVDELATVIRELHPSGACWRVRHEGGTPATHRAADQLRRAYAPMLAAVEPLVLPLRTADAVAAGDHAIEVRHVRRGRTTGVYRLPLWRTPTGGWATLELGLRAPLGDVVSTSAAVRRLVVSRTPVLALPHPTWQWWAARLHDDRGATHVTRADLRLFAAAVRDLVVACHPS